MRTSPASFEEMYRADADPWAFRTRWYEQRRYDLITALLPAPRYGHGFEPGASIGELSARLASRCTRLDTLDASPTAVAAATRRLAGYTNVRPLTGTLPEDVPDDRYDLVVLSEIGYYFDAAALEAMLDAVETTFAPAVTIVACHWLGQSADHQMHGDDTHRIMLARWGRPACALRDADFRADVWARR